MSLFSFQKIPKIDVEFSLNIFHKHRITNSLETDIVNPSLKVKQLHSIIDFVILFNSFRIHLYKFHSYYQVKTKLIGKEQ